MLKFHVLISIKQFTEIPIFLKGVDERIAWQRSWTSWNNLTLPSLSLFQLSSNEDIEIDCSYLATEEFIETTDESKAIEVAVSNANDKLGLLSLLTDKGFSVIGSYVIPQTQQPFSLADNIKWYRDNRIMVKAKTNEEIREEASKPEMNDLTLGLRRFSFVAHETEKTLGESVQVIPQQYELALAKNIERKIEVVTTEELSNSWQTALQNLINKNRATNNSFSRSLNLWMNSRMDRDLNSRFLIDWAALDNLTPHISTMGREKTDKMALAIGPISGIHSKLDYVLYKVYSSRNDIAHSRGSYVANLERFKKELMLLEWIFKNFVRKELGISQVQQQAIPVNLAEILS
jgi:hypothetical protein